MKAYYIIGDLEAIHSGFQFMLLLALISDFRFQMKLPWDHNPTELKVLYRRTA
jgi:hypothetical protein